ncbi:MAG: hypothetical protein GC159_20490 [Phycisphaera sp.]|nr:hypothetical protein [Phycisphaera sp.]
MTLRRWISGTILAVAALLTITTGLHAADAPIAIEEVKLDRPVDFTIDIQPILKKKCIACHHAPKPEAKLSLESVKDMIKGGESGPAVEPGNTIDSMLLLSASFQEKPHMPPAKNKVDAEPMTPHELGLMKLWIAQGAKGPAKAVLPPPVWQSVPTGWNAIYAVAMTGDGQYVAAGRAGQIDLYHVPTRKLVATLKDPALDKDVPGGAAHRDAVQSLAFNTDGTALASGGYRSIKLWQRQLDARTAALGFTADPAKQIADVSANGATLALTTPDNAVQLYNLADGKPGPKLAGHADAVTCVAISPDGQRVATSSNDKTTRVWNAADGKQLTQVDGEKPTTAVGWIDDKRFASATDDNAIHVYQLADDPAAKPTVVKDIGGSGARVVRIHAVPGQANQLLSLGHDGQVRVFDVNGGNQIRAFNHGGQLIDAAKVSDGSFVASISNSNTLKLFKPDGNQLVEVRTDGPAKIEQEFRRNYVNFARSEVNYRTNVVKEAEKTRDSEKEAVKKATEALAAAEKTAKEKKDAFDKETKEFADAEAKFKEAEKKLADAKAKAEDAPKAVEVAKTNVDNANNAVNDLRGKKDQAVNAANQAKTVFDNADRAFNDAKNKLAAADKTLNDAKAKLAETDKALNDAKAKLAETDKALNDAKAKLAEADKALNDAKAKLAEADKAVAEAGADEAKKKAAEEARKQAADAVAKAENDRKPVEQAANDAQNNRNNADAAVKKIEGDRNNADAAVKKAEGDRTVVDTAFKKAEGERKAAEQALATADAAKKTAEETFAKAEATKKDADAKYQESEKDKRESEQARNNADNEYKQAEKKQEEEKKQLADAKGQMEQADLNLTSAKRRLDKANMTVPEAEKAIEVAKAAEEAAKKAQTEAEAKSKEADEQVGKASHPMTALAMSPDGSLVAVGADDGRVFTYGATTGELGLVFEHHKTPVIALRFTDDNTLVSVASDGSVRVGDALPRWNLARSIAPAESTAPPIDRVLSLGFSPDGKLLASGGGMPSREGELVIWNTADGSVARVVEDAHSDTVFDVNFSPDGTMLASAASDRFAKVFDVATGKLHRSFEGHTHHVLGVSWNRDGRILATCSADNSIKTWDIVKGERVKTINGFDKEITALRHLGYTDRFAVAWGGGPVRIVNENGGRERDLNGPSGYMNTVAVTDDGNRIAAGGQDSTLYIWNTNGQEVARFEAPKTGN